MSNRPRKKDSACFRRYHPEYCQQLLELFSCDPYEQHIKGNSFPPKLPTLERFADSLGVRKITLYLWSKRHPEFAHSLQLAIQKQHIFIMDAGLAGIYPTKYAILIMETLGVNI